MSSLSKHHQELDEGEGKCSKPMWSGMGGPAGFCDKPAYGKQVRDVMSADGYPMHVPALACVDHGGPERYACPKCDSNCRLHAKHDDLRFFHCVDAACTGSLLVSPDDSRIPSRRLEEPQ